MKNMKQMWKWDEQEIPKVKIKFPLPVFYAVD